MTSATQQISKNTIRKTLKPLLAEANVNADSFLATDYLNHFNEVMMLFEMLPDMPEMLDEVLSWEPLSYTEHFSRSGLGHHEIIISAYENAPVAFRAAFDARVNEFSDAIQKAITIAAQMIDRNDGQELHEFVEMETQKFQALSAALNRIIHGRLPDDFDEKDEISAVALEEDLAARQAEIDALFD